MPRVKQNKTDSETTGNPCPITPVKAIRKKCVDCCCGALKAVAECESVACPIWPYRMGRRPTQEMVDQFLAVYQEEEEYDE